MTARDIINRLGGVSAVAGATGIPKTTIYSWGQSNQIPQWRQPKLLELATSLNLPLATTDFPAPDERVAA
jgi:DNA-binding phage protein